MEEGRLIGRAEDKSMKARDDKYGRLKMIIQLHFIQFATRDAIFPAPLAKMKRSVGKKENATRDAASELFFMQVIPAAIAEPSSTTPTSQTPSTNPDPLSVHHQIHRSSPPAALQSQASVMGYSAHYLDLGPISRPQHLDPLSVSDLVVCR